VPKFPRLSGQITGISVHRLQGTVCCSGFSLVNKFRIARREFRSIRRDDVSPDCSDDSGDIRNVKLRRKSAIRLHRSSGSMFSAMTNERPCLRHDSSNKIDVATWHGISASNEIKRTLGSAPRFLKTGTAREIFNKTPARISSIRVHANRKSSDGLRERTRCANS